MLLLISIHVYIIDFQWPHRIGALIKNSSSVSVKSSPILNVNVISLGKLFKWANQLRES